MTTDILKTNEVILKSSMVTFAITKAAAYSIYIYLWYSTIRGGSVYHPIIALLLKILQISHKYLLNFLINILVFTSSVFQRFPWLILLYNKFSTGTKNGLIKYCWRHHGHLKIHHFYYYILLPF